MQVAAGLSPVAGLKSIFSGNTVQADLHSYMACFSADRHGIQTATREVCGCKACS